MNQIPATTTASTALTALRATLGNVVRSAPVGRSMNPILQFRSRENGTWTWGQKQTVVEDNARLAVNMETIRHGYICFSADNKVLGEQLVPGSMPKPLVTELPDLGRPWQDQIAIEMKIIDGADAGVQVVYKPTTVGGLDAIMGIIETVNARSHSDQADDNFIPVVTLDRDSYVHQKHGRIWTPVFDIVAWMSPAGPPPRVEPEPKPAPPAPPTTPAADAGSNQPRRRRVA